MDAAVTKHGTFWRSGDDTLPVSASCRCGRARRLPLRVLATAASDLRDVKGRPLPPDLPLMTYRCRVCKEVVVLRAIDLHFSDDTEVVAPRTHTS